MNRNIRRGSRQRGFVAVAYAAMIVGLVGFAGIAVDVGYMQFEKRRVQAAADAAAMGALREIELGQTDLTSAGQNDAALNGFIDGKNNTTVTVNSPPSSGDYAGNASAVEVIVKRTVGTFFMRIFNQNNSTITGRAVARTSSTEGSVGGCIFAMNPTADGALTVNGTVNLSTACGAVVNSTSPSAFTMVGTSLINLASGAQVGVVGPGTAGTGWSLSGGAQLMNSTTSTSEAPVNISTFGDPLANVTAPTPSGLTIQQSNSYTVKPSDTTTLSQGIYCGGIDVKGNATFSAGTYILAGGGLTIDSQATVTGAGVMFYNTSANSQAWGCTGGGGAGSFTFNGGASINLSAPTSSTPCGVLFFDDRGAGSMSHTINGNSTSTFDGAMYFINSNLKFAGTNRTPGFLFIVADTITLTGNANLGNDHSNLINVYTLAPHSTGGGLVE